MAQTIVARINLMIPSQQRPTRGGGFNKCLLLLLLNVLCSCPVQVQSWTSFGGVPNPLVPVVRNPSIYRCKRDLQGNLPTNHRNCRNVIHRKDGELHSSKISTSQPELQEKETNKRSLPSSSSRKQAYKPTILLVVGFESFNKDLYQKASENLDINLFVFTDTEIRSSKSTLLDGEDTPPTINPEFRKAMESAEAFVGSLIFDYDDVLVLQPLLSAMDGPRLLFECATELMSFNRLGTFSMEPKVDEDTGEALDTTPGPPPLVQAILSQFTSKKEEDKMSGYLKMLKIGPNLLKHVPGERAGDLRAWLEAYRYWNQGGASNVNAMLQILLQIVNISDENNAMDWSSLPDLEVTPDIGLLHPLSFQTQKYFSSPKEYMTWRLSKTCQQIARHEHYHLAPSDSPRAAILLYRKHVITEQPYIYQLITLMEEQDILPIPIFINGVEAHTIVRDWLTSLPEIHGVKNGTIKRESSYQSSGATEVDVIVNTIGFPLVGGPAGSMEAGRNTAVAEKLLSDMNVPYIVASPLLLQSIQQWKLSGVLGLQSVVLYALPELDGAIDTVVLGGLVGDKIELVHERVRKLTDRIKGMSTCS